MQVPPLNDNDLNDLLKQPLVAKVGSHGRDDEIRVTPIWFGPEPDGSILMSTFEDSGLVRNVRRNPKCAVCGDEPTIRDLQDLEWSCHFTPRPLEPAVSP